MNDRLSTPGRRVHILTQFVWPDSAPTGIMAEQLADGLTRNGMDVVLVAGTGSYRESERPAPLTPIVRFKHRQGNRKNLVSAGLEYVSVTRGFSDYIGRSVRDGDVVIITSAPPTTIHLYRIIQRQGATAIYWLQDYYPELLRALWDFPVPIRKLLQSIWNRLLFRWNHVVKAAGNLGYEGPNATVIRNWATLDLGDEEPCVPKTALYSGNLGYCHYLPSFVELCEELRREGYQILVRGDGPGISKLPPWVMTAPPLKDMGSLRKSYWSAEVHLVAAHPEITTAVFPSKFWASAATGRRILTSGFSGAMSVELEESLATDPEGPRSEWMDLVASCLEGQFASK